MTGLLLLVCLFLACGIPSPVYLASPRNIEGQLGFYHAGKNDPDVFRGYEIFYAFYSEDPDKSAGQWEELASEKLSEGIRRLPGSNPLMSFSYGASDIPSHPFRRSYTRATYTGNYSIMIPVDQSTVNFGGGDGISFKIKYDESTGLELSSDTTCLADPSDPTTYNTSSLFLHRYIIDTDSSDNGHEIAGFNTIVSSQDDIPEEGAGFVVFFAATVGIDKENPGSIVVSELSYIGEINL